MEKYIERINYNSMITIKLVIPSGCNAKCKFCYLNDYNNIMINDKNEFLNNFINSIKYMLDKIKDKNKVSLDITGNEPTFDKNLLIKVLIMLRDFDIKNKVSRVTITTNGFNLKYVIPYLKDVINYVNISVHNYNEEIRNNIFGCKILKTEDYKILVQKLKEINIPTSAICVIYNDIKNFYSFMIQFISWCKEIGFISLRFRNNVFWQDSKFNKYMEIALNDKENFTIITNENTNDSRWCRLRMKDKFRIFFLNGVKDTSIVTKGIEYIIADDGMIYTDFYKKIPIENYKFEIGRVFDKVE